MEGPCSPHCRQGEDTQLWVCHLGDMPLAKLLGINDAGEMGHKRLRTDGRWAALGPRAEQW